MQKGKASSGSDSDDTLAMMSHELNQDEKDEKGEEENKALETESEKIDLGISLEYTAQEHHSRMVWWKEHLLQSWDILEQ